MLEQNSLLLLEEAEKQFKTTSSVLIRGALDLNYYLYFLRKGRHFALPPENLEELYSDGKPETLAQLHVMTTSGKIIPFQLFYRERWDNEKAPDRKQEFHQVNLNMLHVRLTDAQTIRRYTKTEEHLPYLDEENKYYSPELAAMVNTWTEIFDKKSLSFEVDINILEKKRNDLWRKKIVDCLTNKKEKEFEIEQFDRCDNHSIPVKLLAGKNFSRIKKLL